MPEQSSLRIEGDGCRHSFSWTSAGVAVSTPPTGMMTHCPHCGTWATWDGKRWNVREPSLGARAMLELCRRDDALAEILAVLGTGACQQNKCDGCSWEMQEAVRITKEALGLGTAPPGQEQKP